MCVNTISALFFLCTGWAIGKRDCCILCWHLSVQYIISFCLPHCCRVLQHSPVSLIKGCERRMQNHCADCFKKNECIEAAVYLNAWRCAVHAVRFFYTVFGWAFTNQGQEFSEVALMETPCCTWQPQETTAAKRSTAAGERRLVNRRDLSMFIDMADLFEML